MRIGGLASGMDIDQIVGDLMKAERMPLDKLKQQKQTLEWQRDDYRSMNSLLLNFRSELMNMKLTTQYRSRLTSSTQQDRVTATATSAASASSYSISKVDQLASAATLKNGSKISADGKKVDPTKGLFQSRTDFANKTFGWKAGAVESTTINVTTQENELTIDLKGAQMKDLAFMNVKVNGTSYEVVSTMPANGLAANQVLVDTAGKLTFKDDLTVNSSIKVDYFTDKKVESFTYDGIKKDFQLAKGSIRNDLKLTLGDKEFTIDSTVTAADKPLIDVNDSNKVVGTINVETGKFTLNDGVGSSGEIKVEYTQNYFTFAVSSYTSKGLVRENFGVQGSETLNNVISRVNSSNAGVTMFHDSFSDQLTMTRKETGDFNPGESSPGVLNREIITTGNFLNEALQFGSGIETGGENAKFTINGLDTERSSNTFEMNGVTFTLKQEFTTGAVDMIQIRFLKISKLL